MPSVTRRIFLGSLGCASFAASKSWDEPAFPAWTPEFVDRMLTDSPWARQGTVSFELDPIQRLQSSSYAQIGVPGGIGLPGAGIPGIPWPTGRSRTGTSPSTWPRGGGSNGGGSSVRTEIYLTTRWSSALPIRRALALQEFGADGLKDEKAVDMLTREPDDYVIEVAGFPTTAIRQGAKPFAAELLDSARLIVRGRPPMPATAADVPEYGMHLVATLRFQRFKDLAPSEGLIELSAESRRIIIRERFKLRNMMYGGSLQL